MKNDQLGFLKDQLKNKLYLQSNEAHKLCSQLPLDFNKLLFAILNCIKENAMMPLSQFMVGAIAIGSSGNLYFGVSQDFCYTTTNQCIHAEQSAVYNAFLHREKKITHIVVNAAPCGFCRQFLYEMSDSKDLMILFPENNKLVLGELLPFAFGPNDLGRQGGMLTSPDHSLQLIEANQDQLVNVALKAASRSYSPYWEAYSGVAIQTKDKKIFYGIYLENVAQNPALAPMQAALVHLNLSGYTYDSIEDVVLVEMVNPKISQSNAAQDLLNAVGLNIKLNIVKARCFVE